MPSATLYRPHKAVLKLKLASWIWETRWFIFSIGRNTRMSGMPLGWFFIWRPEEYTGQGRFQPRPCAWSVDFWCNLDGYSPTDPRWKFWWGCIPKFNVTKEVPNG